MIKLPFLCLARFRQELGARCRSCIASLTLRLLPLLAFRPRFGVLRCFSIRIGFYLYLLLEILIERVGSVDSLDIEGEGPRTLSDLSRTSQRLIGMAFGLYVVILLYI